MHHLQHRRANEPSWVTTSSSEDLAKLTHIRDRYAALIAQSHTPAGQWRIIDDAGLVAEQEPFLERVASGPITFIALTITAFAAVLWFTWWWPQ